MCIQHIVSIIYVVSDQVGQINLLVNLLDLYKTTWFMVLEFSLSLKYTTSQKFEILVILMFLKLLSYMFSKASLIW